MQNGQHPFYNQAHMQPPNPNPLPNNHFSLPAMMGLPNDVPQANNPRHHSLPSPSTSSHIHLHPPAQYQSTGPPINLGMHMDASSVAGSSGAGGAFSSFPLDLAGQANGWLEGQMQAQGFGDDEMGDGSSNQGIFPPPMGMAAGPSSATSHQQPLSPTNNSPHSHHSFTQSLPHKHYPQSQMNNIGPGLGSGSGSGAYPIGAIRSPSSSSHHSAATFHQQQQQYGMQPELQPPPSTQHQLQQHPLGQSQQHQQQIGRSVSNGSQLSNLQNEVNGNSPVTPPYPSMRMPAPQYDYTNSFHQQQQQPQATSSSSAQPQTASQPSSAAPSLAHFPLHNKNNSRPGSTSSATASMNGTASRGSDRGSASTASALPENVPRVGGVRCYWAILKPRHPFPQLPNPHASCMAGTPLSGTGQGLGDYSDLDDRGYMSAALGGKKFELDFVHLDPVLAAHMRTQSLSMIGRGVIEFIHPDEREQARKDLYSAISINNLEGSVTRVRFARLSRIRTILGCPPEDDDIPEDAHIYVEDDEYLVLDLSIHWACDGLLLAFFHAIKDKDKQMNNDPTKRSEEWSNFCGTAHFEDQDVENMWTDIEKAMPLPEIVKPAPPPERVFIIHATEESATRPNSVIFAWPPPRMRHQIEENGDDSNMEDPDAVDAQGRRGSDVKPRMDGKYWAEDYAELMKHVELENKGHFDNAWGAFGQTSCQKRFQGGHLMTNEGLSRKIESVFIPYGRITFACFQTVQSLPGVTPALPTVQMPKVIGNDSSSGPGWSMRNSLPPIDTGQAATHNDSGINDLGFEQRDDSPAVNGFVPAENPAYPPLSPVPSAVNRLREITPAASATEINGYPGSQSGEHASAIYGNGNGYIDPAISQPLAPSGQASADFAQQQYAARGIGVNGADTYQVGPDPVHMPPYHPHPAHPSNNSYPTHYPPHNGILLPPGPPIVVPSPYFESNGLVSHEWDDGTGRPTHSHRQSQLITYQADPRGMKRKVEDGMDIAPLLGTREVVYPEPSAMMYAGRMMVAGPAGEMGVPLRISNAMPAHHHTARQFGAIPMQTGSHIITQPLLLRNGNGIIQEPEKKKKREDREARAPVPPPDGIDCCQHCGITESPEWRKNEDGTKNLCNACGLKLARLQAKREGRQKPRKKKSDPVNAPAPVSLGQMAAFQPEVVPVGRTATWATAS